MGNTVCVANEVTPLAPENHYKCRYDKNDKYSNKITYYTHDDINRYPVPENKINISKSFHDYNPTEFTSEKILARKKNNIEIDPNIDDPEYKNLKFNEMDIKYGCDRRSYHGHYKFIRYKPDSVILVPMNPVGRTGVIGRGRLFRWGPNHAADPIVTRWKRDKNGEIETNQHSDKGVLEFVAIQRRQTGEWAVPGGMRDPGEKISGTLIREFKEEALNSMNRPKDVDFNKFERLVAGTQYGDKILDNFFKGGTEIYKGYMDDPRNTDNAWMETLACNFHDETGKIVSKLKLEGGDDASDAKWMELSGKLKLFAGHYDLLREVAALHDAHW